MVFSNIYDKSLIKSESNKKLKTILSSHYNFIDHTADIAVEVKADSLEELFIASALAFRESVMDFQQQDSIDAYKISLNSHSLESLLVNFLNELNFRLTYKRKIFNNIRDLEIFKKDDSWNLECILNETDIDEDKIKTEIKSVTYHQMEIKKIKGEYSTRIVFDI
jgi:SHS2 domain-containing protein